MGRELGWDHRGGGTRGWIRAHRQAPLPQRWLPAACQPLNKGSERRGMWQQAQPGQTDTDGHTGAGGANRAPGEQGTELPAPGRCTVLGCRCSELLSRLRTDAFVIIPFCSVCRLLHFWGSFQTLTAGAGYLGLGPRDVV